MFGIKYKTEKTFDGLVGCRGGLLMFDFYLPNYNICIEYDGIQHFKPIDYFGGERGLRIRQTHDMRKNKYCLRNNIKLIRIKYSDISNIKKLLAENLLVNDKFFP